MWKQLNPCGDSRPRLSGRVEDPAVPGTYYFFFPDDFFAAAFFGAAFFFAEPFAVLASLAGDSTSGALTFLGFASFFGSSGALKLCPSKAISVMRTAVNACRCPRSFFNCFLRL